MSRTRGLSTPLHWAAYRTGSAYDESIVRGMLLRGADPNAANLKAVTPLHLSSNISVLPVFQHVYGRLDGIDHVAMAWDNPNKQSVYRLKRAQHEEDAASDNDESFVTAPRGDVTSLLTAQKEEVGRISSASSTSTPNQGQEACLLEATYVVETVIWIECIKNACTA
ncbi:MAG: hypothetical protein LQ342_004245 [Letrouitia transgressa]|nr:MAG: hypothetical protein LQ342_004245 [Letrouitia transgressa]